MYDFSGISTERLKETVNSATDGSNYDDFCCAIACDDSCPFYNYGFMHCKRDSDKRRIAFKEELNRREKHMNEMPELKAGMIVEVVMYGANEKYLYIDDSYLINLDGDGYSSLDNKDLTKVYNRSQNRKFSGIHEDLKLIWSKKSDKDIETEEILKQIDELKQLHNKFMEDAERVGNDMDKLKTKMEGLKSGK